MRAFRPSRFGRQDEVEEEVERAKQANVFVYSQRARAGLPLFDDSPLEHEAPTPAKLTVRR